MKVIATNTMPASTRHLLLAAGVTAALAAPGALTHSALAAAKTGSAAETTQQATITWGGEAVPAGKLIGSPVMTPENEQIGKIVDLIWRDDIYNDVVIKLSPEYRQTEDVVRGKLVSVPIESLQPVIGSEAAQIEGALVTVDTLEALEEFGLYTLRNDMAPNY